MNTPHSRPKLRGWIPSASSALRIERVDGLDRPHQRDDRGQQQQSLPGRPAARRPVRPAGRQGAHAAPSSTASATASATSARVRSESRSTNSSGVWAPPPRGPSPSTVTGIVPAKWLASLAPPRAAATIGRPSRRPPAPAARRPRRGSPSPASAARRRTPARRRRARPEPASTTGSNASRRVGAHVEHELAGRRHDVERVAAAQDRRHDAEALRARRDRGARRAGSRCGRARAVRCGRDRARSPSARRGPARASAPCRPPCA